jgi:hypothetical protein
MNEDERRAATSPDQHFDRQIDRLVDGELNAAERRQLLAECDEREGAWRRCALAFLEAQSWRTEFTALTAPAPSPAVVIGPTVARDPTLAPRPAHEIVRRRRWVRTQLRTGRDWSTVAGAPWALAACALVAFALGWMTRPQGAAESSVDPTFQTALPSEAIGAGRAIAASDAPNDVDQSLPSDVAAETPETITLVMDCGPDGEQRQIELPVLPTAEDDLAALEQGEPVVSAELQAALLRMGHGVNERRQLVPLVLEDGRRLVVPVDEIEFTPVEALEYQ